MKKRAAEQGKRQRERGSILATSAIGMLAVLLAVGMGIDISRLYLSKAELQNAADAAALGFTYVDDAAYLRSVIEEFVEETGSAWGKQILENYLDYLRMFWLVKPKAASLKMLLSYVSVNAQ